MPDPQETASALWADPDPWISSPLMKTGGAEMGNALMGVASNIASIPQRAFESSEALRNTGQYNPEPVMQAAQLLMGGGMPAAEAGAAGIFGGRLAKGADTSKLLQAMVMEHKGANRFDIWNATGWGRGQEGAWRFEIPDTAATLNEPNASMKYMSDYLNHPELYKNYPQIADRPIDFKMRNTKNWENIAGYYPDKDAYTFNPKYNDPRNPLHEIQHAVQRIEGFPTGANYMGLTPDAVDALKSKGMSAADPRMDKMSRDLAMLAYRRQAGEVEARNVQRRYLLTPMTLKRAPPWATEDVIRELQLNLPYPAGEPR